MTPAPDQLEVAARAIMLDAGCGCSYGPERVRVFCDDPRLPDNIRVEKCCCKSAARAALTAAGPPPWRVVAGHYIYEGENCVGWVNPAELAAQAVADHNEVEALRAEVEKRIASQESEAKSLWKTIDHVTAERDTLARDNKTLAALVEQMVEALNQWNRAFGNVGEQTSLHVWNGRLRAARDNANAVLDAYRKYKESGQ